MHNQNEWAAYDPEKIPSKADIPFLDEWLSAFPPAAHFLDVGCGTGTLSRHLRKRGFRVTGLDINHAAIEKLASEFAEEADAAFHVRNIVSHAGFELPMMHFDAAICQLVASVVGGKTERTQLLQNIHDMLVPAGKLFISFSGLSGDINGNYARIYETDLSLTGEFGSYLSRDEAGRALYQTHHFAFDEIQMLLQDNSFVNIQINEKLEASSRRPNEPARFFYAICEKA